MESTQMKLSRVRKPRVHIVYEVETEGAAVQRELPFVVGVLGDFSGNAGLEKKSFSQRKFIQIDADNFEEVITRIGPAVNISVENTLLDDGSNMSVSLQFKSMSDFEPGQIVKQTPILQELLNARNNIRDLLTKADNAEELEKELEKLLQDSDTLQKIATDLGIEIKKEGE
jgi:type VI secretion system protein ImpB